MKKIFKWIIPLVLAVVFIPCKSVFADTTVSREEKIAVILETGAPESFVNELSDFQINDYYMKFEGRNVEYKGTEEKIVDIIENLDGKARNAIAKDALKLSISIFEDMDDTGVGEVYGLIVGADFKWLKQPICSLTDAMTLNWDGTLFNCQSFYAETGFMLQGEWFPKDFTNTPTLANIGGLGWCLDIASGNLNQGGGSVYLVPKRTLYASENVNMQINFNYAHEVIGASVTFSINSDKTGSVSINFEPGSYDTMAATKIYY